MKKKKLKKLIILLIIIAAIFTITFMIFKKPNKVINITNEQKLINLGYTNDDISIIKAKNVNTKLLLSYDYNKIYIDIIKNDNFKVENLEKYINFNNNFNLDVENTIFVINNNYETTEYNDKILALMHQTYYIHKNLERYLNYLNNLEYTDDNIITTISNVNSNLDNEFYTVDNNTDLSKGYLIIVNKYYKLDENYVPDNLVDIDSKYGYGKLESETYNAFIKMYNDALNDGMNLYIRSPYRSYKTQYNLYNSYAAKDGYKNADTYSARPGYSEHQTGLAMDLTTSSTTLGTFESTKEFKWMKENCYKYGFILRYPKGKEYMTGYIYEPWHYRYVGVDAAQKIYEENITFEEYYAYYVEK